MAQQLGGHRTFIFSQITRLNNVIDDVLRIAAFEIG